MEHDSARPVWMVHLGRRFYSNSISTQYNVFPWPVAATRERGGTRKPSAVPLLALNGLRLSEVTDADIEAPALPPDRLPAR
jgi:hypothetical protein